MTSIPHFKDQEYDEAWELLHIEHGRNPTAPEVVEFILKLRELSNER